MRKTRFSASMLALGLALASCGDGSHGEDVSALEDSLKGRGPSASTPDASALEGKPEANPCALLLCPADTRCVVKEVQCIRAPCPPVASCEPIAPPTTCAATQCKEGTTCVEGPKGATCVEPASPGCAAVLCRVGTTCVEGPNGAECVEHSGPSCALVRCRAGTTCVDGPKGAVCVPACTAECAVGQHCELQEVQCIRAPCPPVPTCVDDLDACAAVRCKDGTHCVSTQPQCFTTPCPPHAECVPN